LSYLFISFFLAGILFGVRLIFFGAERRRLRAGVTPLRRSEPAIVGFVFMFGLAGYLFHRSGRVSPAFATLMASATGVVWAYVVTRVAIATARMVPLADHEDPRFVLQGHVAVVTVPIDESGNGAIRYDHAGRSETLPARNIGTDAIAAGEEVCIERLEDGVAIVERWALVEKRL
jgi:membrane protein implicated in regulation of membrane protease activity